MQLNSCPTAYNECRHRVEIDIFYLQYYYSDHEWIFNNHTHTRKSNIASRSKIYNVGLWKCNILGMGRSHKVHKGHMPGVRHLHWSDIVVSHIVVGKLVIVPSSSSLASITLVYLSGICHVPAAIHVQKCHWSITINCTMFLGIMGYFISPFC